MDTTVACHKSDIATTPVADSLTGYFEWDAQFHIYVWYLFCDSDLSIFNSFDFDAQLSNLLISNHAKVFIFTNEATGTAVVFFIIQNTVIYRHLEMQNLMTSIM